MNVRARHDIRPIQNRHHAMVAVTVLKLYYQDPLGKKDRVASLKRAHVDRSCLL